MESQMKAGDVVQLKSSGPKMTIDKIRTIQGAPGADCDWFVNNEQKSGAFPLTSLKLAEDARPAVAVVSPKTSWS